MRKNLTNKYFEKFKKGLNFDKTLEFVTKLSENQDDIDLSALPSIERPQLCDSYPDVTVESQEMLALKQCKSGTQAI